MADIQLRDWQKVRSFHRIWMQLLEQGKVQWEGSQEQQNALKMRHLYLAASPKGSKSKSASPTTKVAGKKRDRRTNGGKGGAGSNRRVCMAFNSSKGCDQKMTHGNFQHKCAYCLKKTGFSFNHAEPECTRKKEDTGGN
jgi:hypothetical protein